jgi:hypothetical protein
MKSNLSPNPTGPWIRAGAIALILAGASLAQKQIHSPSFLAREGTRLTDCNTQWCYDRSVQTDNWIILWEKGFGADPATASGAYKINMEALKATAEKSYAMFVDSLRMTIKGSSVTDKYKQMIFLLYTTDWGAWGSGQDDLVGTLHVNPAAANIATVVSHEIGHTFQYLTGCDVKGAGFRWGFGDNGAGGNGYWEQVAQWMAFKTYPAQQFTASDFRNYIASNHLHILHESPRYANYFLPDYWAFKRGPHFQGRLWREAKRPEDPVETYKRLTGVTQEEFNDEIYEHASRLTTWDLPAIKTYGANYIDIRAQVKMNKQANGAWLIDPSVTIENYGYNSIKLNAPGNATTVSVDFEGKTGASGFRSLNAAKGGWRYGFVALLKDGTRVYSPMATAKMSGTTNPKGRLEFAVPANCSKLWLVVSGAPQEHWRHAWDDNNANDEHWPYQVLLGNTNLLGQTNLPAGVLANARQAGQASFTVREGTLWVPEGAELVEILDVNGRIVRSVSSASSGRGVALEALPKGVLMVRIKERGANSALTGTVINQ